LGHVENYSFDQASGRGLRPPWFLDVYVRLILQSN